MLRVLAGGVVAPVVLLLASGGAAPALADPNPPVPVDQLISLPAGAVCAFAVDLHVVGKAKLIELPGGGLIFTAPSESVVVTNADQPDHSVTIMIPGASHISTEANGDVVIVVTGRNLQFDPVAGFVLAVGRFQYRSDAGGNLVESLNGHGQLIDVCQLVA
jgi:hypothetical protein